MTTSIPKKVFTVIFAIILLLSGCTPAKIQQATPGTETQQTVPEQNTQPQTTVEQTGTAPQEITNAGTQAETTANEPPAVKVKALYLTGWTVGSTKKVEHYIELAKNTEINSYVVDIKDDDGYVGYESQIPEVKEAGTWTKKYDVDKVLKAFHDNGVHVIGRLVCFKDPIYSVKRPDLAIKNVNGGIYKDSGGVSWLNPYNQDNWTYLVNIAKEAAAKGFDEIQFDYVRFPSDRKKSMDFSGANKEKYQAISDFLAYAKSQMPGVIISADIFGITLESPDDTEQIGQFLEHVGKDIDFISPMAYPSHYAYGQIVNKVKFPAPDLEPYKVVYNTLAKGKDRLSKVTGYKAKVRPYLQDFTAAWLRPRSMYQEYGPVQVKEQVKAVYDAGYEEWILWYANNTYHEEALSKEGE